MDGILNLELMKHPMNWIVIPLMVFIFMLALALVTGHYKALTFQAANLNS